MFIKPASKRGSAGATLIDFLFGMTIGMIVITAVAALTIYTARSFAAMQNYADLDDKSRNALDYMTRDIRQVTSLTSFSTNRLDFLDGDGVSTLTYLYDPTAATLTRIKNGVRQTLLTGCDDLSFAMFQRNPIAGTFNQFSNTLDATTCKLVQVSWICSRSIMQGKVNTESVQTAKIVIRKQ
jgi:hypothetical protein